MGYDQYTCPLYNLLAVRYHGCQRRRLARDRVVICIGGKQSCMGVSFPGILDIVYFAAPQYHANAFAFLSHKLGFDSCRQLDSLPDNLP